MIELLQANDIAAMRGTCSTPFLPALRTTGTAYQYKDYWASVFYSYFAARGVDVVLEYATNRDASTWPHT